MKLSTIQMIRIGILLVESMEKSVFTSDCRCLKVIFSRCWWRHLWYFGLNGLSASKCYQNQSPSGWLSWKNVRILDSSCPGSTFYLKKIALPSILGIALLQIMSVFFSGVPGFSFLFIWGLKKSNQSSKHLKQKHGHGVEVLDPTIYTSIHQSAVSDGYWQVKVE